MLRCPGKIRLCRAHTQKCLIARIRAWICSTASRAVLVGFLNKLHPDRREPGKHGRADSHRRQIRPIALR